ncbi:MAG: DM13 domain-containing protein, partial [Chitinophagaceae bacterium]|nr:DM13 domain-containing protein [Chitinophagaceae bacterium]
EKTPDDMLDEPITGSGMILAEGAFSGSGSYQVSGKALILEQNGTKFLRLENFSASNGPDLKVYLSRDRSASSFITLGSLKSVSGNQNYALTGMPDLAEYPYALIWCQQFGVLFGAANLK